MTQHKNFKTIPVGFSKSKNNDWTGAFEGYKTFPFSRGIRLVWNTPALIAPLMLIELTVSPFRLLPFNSRAFPIAVTVLKGFSFRGHCDYRYSLWQVLR